MKNTLLNIFLFLLLFSLWGCNDNCVGFRDEPKLTFTTTLHTPVEIYDKDYNKHLGTLDSGRDVVYAIDVHYTGMNFTFKYPSGFTDLFWISYNPFITFQNRCDYQVYLDSFQSQFTKRNIYKSYSIDKSPRRSVSGGKVREDGYIVEFY